nr:GtrA family protein [Lacrimispora amygdalina]
MCILKKYQQPILYLFFGICTTIVNIITYYLSAHILSLSVILSTCLAWLVSVIFAYITNKWWVFESKSLRLKAVIQEFLSFTGCRLFTGACDLLIMLIFVDSLGMDDLFVKIASNILVVVLNYIFSKMIIFKRK